MTDLIIQRSSKDQLASQKQINWAVGHLSKILVAKNITVNEQDTAAETISGPETVSATAQAVLRIIVAGADAQAAKEAFQKRDLQLPNTPESFGLIGDIAEGTLTAVGSDIRGLVYALLELADRVKHASEPIAELKSINSLIEQPSNFVRSITRLFSCELEDKPWFYDHSFWDDYLTELATHRFNRFSFGTGLGYDYLIDKRVTDNYFCFIYPFLFQVPGYDVQVAGLSDEERDKNLKMLQYISEQANLRGLQFHLGLWNHAYEYGPLSTNLNYKINGLSEANHPQYCRDALKILLKSCPVIEGVTFRIHFEGGVPEPTHDFWRVAIQGVKDAGRPIEIDMHAKGLNEEMMEIALDTGMPFVISPKYWAEHTGLSYHQASIRDREFHPNESGGVMGVTSKRSYTRYGYADYLRKDRPYGVVYRMWPGTQRLLLWGDPKLAAGYGRYGSISGSLGVEWFEPLAFKGRKGSGVEGGYEQYADDSLKLSSQDWKKYEYTYRLWGRLSYNPDADPESWKRFLRTEYPNAADAIEQALAHSSRILPFITVAHAPSVANVVYWPEVYTNLPIVKIENPPPFRDPEDDYVSNYNFDMEYPYTFGSTSTLDPVLFYQINDFAEAALHKRRSGKYTPLETADRLDQLADEADRYLAIASDQIDDPQRLSFRRLALDVHIQIGLGKFFARKFRAAIAYALYERTGETKLLKEAIEFYHAARAAWMQIVDITKGVYKEDLAFGIKAYSRGHWADRVEAIDQDIAAMERALATCNPKHMAYSRSMSDIVAPLQKGIRPTIQHEPVRFFHKGAALEIKATIPQANYSFALFLHYRHLNQSEAYAVAAMEPKEAGYSAVVPASYIDSAYPLQYFFEVKGAAGDSWLVPGLDEHLSNQPYYIVQPN
jgi:hypothetical protein